MSARTRRIVFMIAGAGIAVLLLWGMRGLPPFGVYPGPYGIVLNHITVSLLHATDVVSAVNFDYRGLDTIGEEFILFASVAGVALLLRTERDEIEAEPPSDETVDKGSQVSDAMRAWCLALVGPVIVLALYIISHGQLTPGGGFQGGVILTSALLLIYLGGEYSTLHKVLPVERSELGDALGAGGFVLIGLAGLIAGATFLQNVIPHGPGGSSTELDSGGTIPLISLSVGLEVAGGFLVILSEFLRQTLQVREQARAQRERAGSQQNDERQADQAEQPEQAEEEHERA